MSNPLSRSSLPIQKSVKIQGHLLRSIHVTVTQGIAYSIPSIFHAQLSVDSSNRHVRRGDEYSWVNDGDTLEGRRNRHNLSCRGYLHAANNKKLRDGIPAPSVETAHPHQFLDAVPRRRSAPWKIFRGRMASMHPVHPTIVTAFTCHS